MDIPWKTLTKTVLKSLVMILPVNLIVIALAVFGPIDYNSMSEMVGEWPSQMFKGLMLLAVTSFSYMSIGYFGGLKEKKDFRFCLVAASVCYIITTVITYILSYYLFVNNMYNNIYIPGLWHYEEPPGSGGAGLGGELARLADIVATIYIIFKFIFGFGLALVASVLLPQVLSLNRKKS